MNKRFVSLLLALALFLMCVPAMAEQSAAEQPAAEPVEITVGSTNQMSGFFFTDMWGNNTADIDVRALLHAYSTVAISRNGTYEIDTTVVNEARLTQDFASGDKTYTFEINPDLVYNDGTPITAADFVFSVLLQAAPEIYELGGIPSGMSQFVGYEAYASGETDVFAGVRLLDEHRFALTISGEYLPYFYETLLISVTPYPVSVIAPGFEVADDGEGAYLRYAATEEAEDEAADAAQAEAPELVDVLRESILDEETGYLYNPQLTSGPYSLVSYDKEAHVATFEINENYLGNFEGRKPTIDRIVFKQVYNDTLLEELESGEVDIVNKVTAGDVISDGIALLGQEGSTLNSTNYLRAGYGFLALSCDLGVTQSQNVRQAIAYLTDAEGFLAEFLRGYGMRTYSYYGYGQWMATSQLERLNTELNHYDLNVDAAIALLEEEGFTLNADGEAYDAEAGGVRYRQTEDGSLEALSVRWATLSDNPGCETLMEYTIPYMEQAGFEVLTDEMTFSEMLTYYYRQTDRTYNMFYMATNFDFIFDPYYTFHPGEEYQGTRNTSGIADEELFNLAGELRRTDVGDNETYLEKWFALQQRYNEVLPTIPLYSNVYFDFYSSEVYGYQPSAYYSWASAILYATYGYEETPVVVEEASLEGEAAETVTID